MKKNVNTTPFEEILDRKYGERGTVARESWEQEFEAFQIGVLIEEARHKLKLTQQELADRCGTSKTYISRIENNSSDIRLSTLMRIINKGLGGKLLISLDIA
jgi:HTH-type transcriptional regulator / antitoxin HipB